MLDDFREWLSDNLRYILLGLAILLVLIIAFCVVRLVRGSSSSGEPKQQTVQTQTETQKAETPQTEEPVTESDAGAAAQAAVTSDLVKDDAAVLTLTRDYYTAVAAEDTATLATIVDPWDEQVESATLSGNEIESYNNIKTYSKKGLDDGSYVVFAYFEAKVPNVDTLAPTLAVLYLKSAEDGKLTVYPFKAHPDTAIDSYIAQVKTDDDVQALVQDVKTAFDAAVASDEKLKEYVDTVNNAPAQTQEQETEEGSSDAFTQATMTTAYGVNVRSEANANASIVASLAVGTSVNVIGQTSDGTNTWYQVQVDLGGGQTAEGYIRSDLLSAGG